jgi:carboxypeptidase Taq
MITPYQKLKAIFAELAHYNYIQRIMTWDEAVMMPEGAGVLRAEALATLSTAIQKKLVSKKNKNLLTAAKQQGNLSFWDSANLNWMEKKYLHAACLPTKLVEKITKETLTCQQVWRKLRSQNHWREFLPHLKRVFKLTKEVAKRRSDALQLQPYDALLDEYAPGFNQKNIDEIFAGLKKAIPDLINQITQKQKNEHIKTPSGPFAIEKQKKLGLSVMRAMQFDFQHGRLDVSHHPFCDGNPLDVRITTRYNENEFLSALNGICHETGHGLYEQGLPREWIDQPVGRIDSMAMHESQSLLIEMQICCSLPFYQYVTPEIQHQFGQQDALTADNLYKLITRVQPGFIRVDADEVTYPLHVILRYEIEKKLFNDEVLVEDLPACWDELMQNYLGLSTKNNYQDGVMQDVHWPAGAFGYFPAYTLGRLIAAQLFATFIQSHPQFYAELKQGKFQSLHNWLQKNIYAHAASLPTNDLLMKVTGEPLNSVHFIQHIQKRYL